MMTSNYRVQCVDGNRWRIVDRSEKLVFVGTKEQGEDWLDRQENLVPRPSIAGAWSARLLQALSQPLARLLT